MEKFPLIFRIIISSKEVNYINERGMLLTTRRDLKSCAKRINRALRGLEETMDEWPGIRDGLTGGDREIGRCRAQKVGYTHFRLNSIKRRNLPVDRTR